MEDTFLAGAMNLSQWRGEASVALQNLNEWLYEQSLDSSDTELRLKRLRERLGRERLVIALVAEYSRGKSELINALFFGHFDRRIVPSSSGRTTMCPTEMQWAAPGAATLRLLPIETRMAAFTVEELKGDDAAWETISLDTNRPEAMHSALQRVSETVRVSQDKAAALGFTIDPLGESGLIPEDDDEVEVPRWRHAVFSFDHPLLEQGLVILDTPGLNAIGAEPELTISQLPGAHAVLFVLGADTGVTQSDLTIWRRHVSTAGPTQRHVVVLNKIDSLWDGIRTEEEVDAELRRQISGVAARLGIATRSVFAVSAQQGLRAQMHRDEELLEHSQIPALRNRLTQIALGGRYEVLRESILSEVDTVVERARSDLLRRVDLVNGEIDHLQPVLARSETNRRFQLRKIQAEKIDFDEAARKYAATRAVFTDLSNQALQMLGRDALRADAVQSRAAMKQANFSVDLRRSIIAFFDSMGERFDRSQKNIDEIYAMLQAMYKRFAIEHDIAATPPKPMSLASYRERMLVVRKLTEQEVGGISALLSHQQTTISERFHAVVANEARLTVTAAHTELQGWLTGAIGPLERRMAEHHKRLRVMLDTFQQLSNNETTARERISELESEREGNRELIDDLSVLTEGLHMLCGRLHQ